MKIFNQIHFSLFKVFENRIIEIFIADITQGTAHGVEAIDDEGLHVPVYLDICGYLSYYAGFSHAID